MTTRVLPASANRHLNQTISLPRLSLLVIDEADLILSYGHSDDLQRLLDPSQNWIPRVGVQGVLMRATLGGADSAGGANADVEKLKGLALRNPVSGQMSGCYSGRNPPA